MSVFKGRFGGGDQDSGAAGTPPDESPYAPGVQAAVQAYWDAIGRSDTDRISYLVNQILAMLMQSTNVDEIFSEDDDIRRKCKKVLERHMAADDEVDQEVRNKIKNLQEGTKTWEVEYARVLEQVKRRRGVS